MPAPTRSNAILAALGSLLPKRRKQKPPRDGQLVTPLRDDFARSYPTVGITPSRALSLLQTADAGAPADQFELFREMLQKWPRLAAVEATRRLALTGLDWEILPARAKTRRESDAARRAADECESTLRRLDNFRDVLDHLARALAFGVSVAELVWEDARLVDIVPVPHTRLATDPQKPWRLRVKTADDHTFGVPLDEQPAKWIVHSPRATSAATFDTGLLRASVLLYIAQNISFKDWLVYSQIASMPVRIGRFEPGTPENEKRELLRMLEQLGTDAVAILSKSVQLDTLDARGAGDKPFLPLQEYCNTEITILWLGQHLTTDIRQSGSRAAAEIHDRVREDLLVDDIRDEGQTLRRDLLTRIARARFGDDVPVPEFRRSLIQSVDTRVLADTLKVAVRDLGMRVPRTWVHETLGIPEPDADEPVLLASDAALSADQTANAAREINESAQEADA